MGLTDDEITAVEDLIGRLVSKPALTKAEIDGVAGRWKYDFLAGVDDPDFVPPPVLEAPKDGLYRQSQASFEFTMRSIKNDTFEQVAIIARFYDRLWTYGEIVPPAFMLRLAIILSKAKRRDLELRLLGAWSKHEVAGCPFPFASVANAKLFARLTKLRLKSGG